MSPVQPERIVQRWPPPGRVLVFAPHPDDEVCGPGGTLALHAEQGDPVRVVVAFDGAAGDPAGRFADADLARLRQAEARAGGALLGLASYAFLGHPEGHELAEAELALGARQLADEIERWRPDLVYAPWCGEAHVDHRSVARAALRAFELCGYRGLALGYEVWSPLAPGTVVDITAVAEKKHAALLRHATQQAYGDLARRVLTLNAWRAQALGCGRFAEAFAPLGPREAA